MAETITIQAPEGFKPTEGQPIQFDVPIQSLDLKKIIPQDLQDRAYWKKFEGEGGKGFKILDLFKSFDEAQKALGTRPKFLVPGAEATDEDWAGFFGSLRPAKADEYKFEENKDLPAELKSSPEFQKQIRDLFHANGISVRQATALAKGWDGIMIAMHKAEQAKRQAQDQAFDALVKQHFGEAGEEKIAFAKKLIEQKLPKELAGKITGMTNEELVGMALVLNLFAEKYMPEDDLNALRQGGGSGKSVDELRKDAQAKIVEMNKLDAMDPRKAKLDEEIKSMYAEIAKLTK